MDNKIYQVFISSTYSDLQEERRSVAEAISKSGQIPAGMEYFPASSQQQFEYIKRIIDRCDYYVLLIAGKYGSIAPSGVSYTEEEYKYAVSRKLPVLAFLLRDIATIPSGKVEKEQKKIRKLEAFRNEVSSSRIVDFWEDSRELPGKVAIAVTQEINLNPGVGWVRGDQAIDPKIYEENNYLRQRLSAIEDDDRPLEFNFPKNLDPIDSEIQFKIKIEKFVGEHPWEVNTLDSSFMHEVKTSWKSVFQRISLDLQSGARDFELQKSLADSLGSQFKKLEQNDNTRVEISMLDQNIQRVLDQLTSYGLVTSEEAERYHAGNSLITGGYEKFPLFRLTEKGKTYRAFLAISLE